MQFDTELVTAEFIFLMNIFSVLQSSSFSCQSPEPIWNRVTYILVLWLLNPFIHLSECSFISCAWSDALSTILEVMTNNRDCAGMVCGRKKHLEIFKISRGVYGCLSLQQYNSMKHSRFWLRSWPLGCAHVWKQTLPISSFMFMYGKDVKIRK